MFIKGTHQHSYERINQDDILYFINGLGGRRRAHTFVKPRPDSSARYNQNFGAILIIADDSCINFSFYSWAGELIDSVTVAQ